MSVLRAILLFLLAVPQAAAGPPGRLNEQELRESLRLFVSQPPGEYRLRMRLTSRGNDNASSVSKVVLRRDEQAASPKFFITVQGREQELRYCLHCADSPEQARCKHDDGLSALPDDLRQPLPGTLLPWAEIVAPLCTRWSLRLLPAGAASPDFRVVEMTPSGRTWSDPAATTRAFIDPFTGNPDRFQRIDAGGQVIRSVRILETGSLRGRTGVRRALVELAEGKVLLEVRSVSLERIEGDPSR